MLTVDLGDTVELEAKVQGTLSKELVDPDEPLFRVLQPNGETVDPEVEHPSIGKFLCTFDPTEDGVHEWLYAGEGEWKTAGEAKFRVREPKVPRD